MRLFLPSLLMAVTAATAAPAASGPEFHRDVLPILQKNCQGCHRAGEAAPMPLLTYSQVRPWAKAIRESVRLKRMPPWFADPQVGHFANDRSMSAKEIETLVAWADGGAKEGNPKDAPRPVAFLEGWNIGKPDVVFEMPAAIDVPAEGTIEYTYVILPTNFTEDRWVSMSEVRPGNRAVVHHVIAYIREPGSKWLKDAQPGVPYVPKKGSGDNEAAAGGQWLVGYAPGMPPDAMAPGQARLVKAGSEIVLQLHYTANGKAASDKTRIGLAFAKETPKQRVYTLGATNTRFVIPPGADNHKVESSFTLGQDVTLTALMPHMHLRGKAFEFRAVYPDGRREELLRVPRYSFKWQLAYELKEPRMLPAGTRIECTAWFDNSPNNPDNPDPKSEVRFGEQSWEEMMIGFFNVAFDPSTNIRSLMQRPQRKAPAQQPSAE